MPVALVKLPNEPIVIVIGDVPVEDHIGPIRSVFAQIDRLATETRTRMYCIADMRHVSALSFSDILIILDELRSAPTGSPRDPRVRTCVVGTHDLLPIAIKKLRQQYGLELPLFDTLEDALAAIRDEIAGEPARSAASE